MNYNYILILLLYILIIVLICIIFKEYKNVYENFEIKEKNIEPLKISTKKPELIKIICQTYHTKSLIPEIVTQNIYKYFIGFQYVLYNDNECLKFLDYFDNKYYYLFENKKYPYFMEGFTNKKIKTKEAFTNLKLPAHKADLFRYCYLYEYGGVYADIKTEFIKDIYEIIQDPSKMYISIGIPMVKKYVQIYQGFIYSPVKNDIFLLLIHNILLNIKKNNEYLYNTKFLYNVIKNESINKKVIPGLNKMKNYPDIYLFQEINEDKKECKNSKDRYNLCVHLYDKGIKMIKTRYDDYPWDKKK